MISLLLVIAMCGNLLAGCSTAAVAASPAVGIPLEGSQAQIGARPLYCVSNYSGSGYIEGQLLDNETEKPVEYATVTLLDAEKKPCLGFRGKEQKTTTNKEGWFSFFVRDLDTYEATYYVEAEKEGYYHLTPCRVVYINLADFKNIFEKKVQKEYLPKVEGILEELKLERLDVLWEEGLAGAADKEAFRKEYNLDALLAKKEMIEEGAEQVANIQWGDFWKKVEGELNGTWEEWFNKIGKAMDDGVPEPMLWLKIYPGRAL